MKSIPKSGEFAAKYWSYQNYSLATFPVADCFIVTLIKNIVDMRGKRLCLHEAGYTRLRNFVAIFVEK